MMCVIRVISTGLVWLWVAGVFLVVDQVSKNWMADNLLPFQPYEVLPFFNLTLAYNTGAAFSFLHSASGWQHVLLGGLAVVVSISILVWLTRISSKERWTSIALCLILTGALGNAWDRLQHGYVIDFMDFHLGGWHFAIFNIADCAISIGAFMLILSWVFQKK